jgi:hypothetical protein
MDFDADIAFVLRHPRFRGVSPSEPSPRGRLYTVKIRTDGHDLGITDTLVRAFRRAAAALRRLP